MVYISKKRGIKDFFKTRNLKYYIAFFVLFLAIIAVIVIISKNIKPEDNKSEENSDAIVNETTTEYQEENIISARGVYKICINKSTHMVAAYAYDEESGSYSDYPARYMLAGISDLNDGTYSSDKGTKSSWYQSDNGFYRYCSDFGDNIIFHSALYNIINDKNSLNVEDYNTIGANSDNIGITLQLVDAKWVYENCSFESEVVVYQKEDEKIDSDFVTKIDIPEGITWEPTDNSETSVWCQSEIATLDCEEKLNVKTGSNINSVLSHVNARNKAGESVISYVYITGNYNLNKAGVYNITLNLLDIFGNHMTKNIELTVEEIETETATNNNDSETTPASSDIGNVPTVSQPTKQQDETEQQSSEAETTIGIDESATTHFYEETTDETSVEETTETTFSQETENNSETVY